MQTSTIALTFLHLPSVLISGRVLLNNMENR
jgi:hypothetical protein